MPAHAMTRHLLGLVAGKPGARAFRRYLSETAIRTDIDAESLLRGAVRFIAPSAAWHESADQLSAA
jgi:tRNA-dihydrouridine synthase A